MQVLLTGASGFIGGHLAHALIAAGYDVLCAMRRPPTGARAQLRYVRADFTADVDSAVWAPRLRGVQVVINAAGILREQRGQSFYAIHVRGPTALFNACVLAGVQHVIQISALGADGDAQTAYHRSKHEADEALARLPLKWVIVQPSIVYGANGASAALFDALASAPLVPVPGAGEQQVQPIHIADVVDGVLALLAHTDQRGIVLPFVGPRPLALREFLADLRYSMGLPTARFLHVPLPLVRAAARAGSAMRRGLLDRDTLGMLMRGNTGDPAPLERLLQHRARPAERFVDTAHRAAVAQAARLAWLLPVLRYALAFLWIVSGVVSLGPFPIDESLRRLAAVGITNEAAAGFMLYGAALFDIGLGIATLVVARRRVLWLVQIALVLVYTAIISVRLPEFWLEPFGPVTKNVPLLAALWLLYELDGRRRWNT